MSRTRKSCLPRIENLESRLVLSTTPTAQEQLMLELINEVRTNPGAAAERIEATLSESTLDTIDHFNVDLDKALQEIAGAEERAPVAWDSSLAKAAEDHSNDLIRRNTQSHFGPNGETLADRLNDVGYKNYDAAAENVMARAESVDQAMQAFLIDWNNPGLGHREAIQQPDSSKPEFNEVGLAVVPMPARSWNPFLGNSSDQASSRLMVTQVFASEKNAGPKVLGVVYNDKDGNAFYSEGEGIANARIRLVDTKTGDEYSATSWSSGGYQVEVPAGTYLVTAEVDGKQVSSFRVDVDSQNVKVDFDLTRTRSASKPAQAVATTAPVSKPTTSTPAPKVVLVKTPPVTPPTTSASEATPKPSTAPAPAPASTPTPAAATTDNPSTESPSTSSEEIIRADEGADRTMVRSFSSNSRGIALLIRYRAAVSRRFLLTSDVSSDAPATPTTPRFTSLRAWRA